jgi:hypothetical protein
MPNTVIFTLPSEQGLQVIDLKRYAKGRMLCTKKWDNLFQSIVLYRILATTRSRWKMLVHKKLSAALTFIVVVAIVGGISWALLSSNAPPELSIQEQVRDDAMTYIKTSHPETAQFMNNLTWTGGRTTPENILGAETYTYISQGWNVTIHYPVIANPTYAITADYSATSAGGVSIPYRVMWQGTWENGNVTETSYTFAQ